MKRLLVYLLCTTAMISVQKAEASTYPTSLWDVAFYARQNLNVAKSDIQGWTVAGEVIAADSFGFGTQPEIAAHAGVISGGSFHLSHGSVRGDLVTVGMAKLHHAKVDGNYTYVRKPEITSQATVTGDVLQLQNSEPVVKFLGVLENELAALQVRIKKLKPNGYIEFDDESTELGGDEELLYFSLNEELVFRRKTLILPETDACYVVNFPETFSADIIDLDIQASPELAGRILFNFPIAQNIRMRNTANAEFGLPGVWLAPKAQLHGGLGLVTGSIWTRSAHGVEDFPFLQINFAPADRKCIALWTGRSLPNR